MDQIPLYLRGKAEMVYDGHTNRLHTAFDNAEYFWRPGSWIQTAESNIQRILRTTKADFSPVTNTTFTIHN